MPALALEFFLLFFVAPALFTVIRHRIPAIPALWVLAAYCLYVLWHDPLFDRRFLWNASALYSSVGGVLSLFVPACTLGIFLVRYFAPDLFLNFPRSKPLVWGAVMLLYPVLSVYPQGIVYRAFIFQRYQHLFPAGWEILVASAAAFAFVHIVFRNLLAVGLTFVAGLLFSARYMQTDSLLVSSLEHALYGCAIFTIGLGQSFYYRAQVLQSGKEVPDVGKPVQT
jgi:membrane protease YdiL (CAAX protease family)